MWKSFMLRLVCLLLPLLPLISLGFFSFLPASPRYASLVLDTATGRVLYSRQAQAKIYPASLTKMMTLYMVFDALKKKKLHKHSLVKVSHHAARQEPSNIGLKPGDRLTVEQAILSLVCRSANDSAVALAEKLGGSERYFAQKMTHQARRLGLQNTRFYNASGLFHPYQVTTAKDMARLGVTLLKHFPKEYRYFQKTHFVFRGKLYRSHNRLLRKPGVDGLKTGYIRKSGFNLVTSAKKSGRRLMGVVIGGKTAQWRDRHMMTLLNQGFQKCSLPPVSLRKRRLSGSSGALPKRRKKRRMALLRTARLPKPAPKPRSKMRRKPVYIDDRKRYKTSPQSLDDLLSV